MAGLVSGLWCLSEADRGKGGCREDVSQKEGCEYGDHSPAAVGFQGGWEPPCPLT